MNKITFNLDDVNVQNIMNQIHQNIKTRGYDLDDLQRLNSAFHLPATISGIAVDERLASSIKNTAAMSCIQYWWPIPKGIGFKGKVRVLLNKIVRKFTFFYLKHTFDQQNQFNQSALNTISELAFAIDRQKQENNELNLKITGLKNENLVLQSAVQRLGIKIDEISEQSSQQIADLNESFSKRHHSLDNTNLLLASRIRSLESPASASAIVHTDSDVSAIPPPLSFDYLLFESRFRGDSNSILNRQRDYLEYFSPSEHPVLDIGCGRGEFLSLLSESGITAVGVDSSAENIRLCLENGLDATETDLFDYLSNLSDHSLGGIFCAQVIEHLPTQQLESLLSLAKSKLAENAPLILETLNPQCLMIFAESFYLDPSHIRPVHPLTLEFQAACHGFTDVKIIYRSPSDPALKLDPSNPGFNAINDLLFGYREYALICRNPKEVV